MTTQPHHTAEVQAYADCVNSDQFTQRALDWACTNAYRHGGLVATIEDYFLDSPEFSTWVEDVQAGEDTA